MLTPQKIKLKSNYSAYQNMSIDTDFDENIEYNKKLMNIGKT
jgi:hypothetical protein